MAPNMSEVFENISKNHLFAQLVRVYFDYATSTHPHGSRGIFSYEESARTSRFRHIHRPETHRGSEHFAEMYAFRRSERYEIYRLYSLERGKMRIRRNHRTVKPERFGNEKVRREFCRYHETRSPRAFCYPIHSARS